MVKGKQKHATVLTGLFLGLKVNLLIAGKSNPTWAVYPQESGHQQHLGQVS